MKTRFLLFGFSVLVLITFTTFSFGTVWGQEYPATGTEEELPPKKEIPEKVLPKVPTEAPGYFPRGMAPSPASSLELSNITTTLGPVSGVLAPYGNPAAYDTLARGWVTNKLGVFRVTPFLEYDGLFRTNVFQTSSDKQSDFANIINPGLRFELPIAQRHRLSLGYLGNYFIYSRFNELNHYDQNANLDLLLNLRGGLTARLGNAFRYATIEPTSDQPRSRPYYRDTPYVNIDYNVSSKTKIQGFYQFDLLDFQVGDVNSYGYQTGGVALYYKFWPKTAALAQYIFSSYNYPNSSSSNSITNSPLIGLTWDITAKLSGTAKFGYSFINYEKNLPDRNNSPSNWIMSVQTLYRFSRYTDLTLTVQRSRQDDVDFNNSPFWSTGIFVNLSHDWHYFKTTTYMGFAFINDSYINSTFDINKGFLTREDNFLYLSFGASRPITRWLRFRVDYNYANRSSNFTGYNYNEHRVLFGIQTSF
jgi:hypothetical protein